MSARPSLNGGSPQKASKGLPTDMDMDEEPSTLMRKQEFDALKSKASSHQDDISDAGSEKDEEIPVYEESSDAPMDEEACNSPAASNRRAGSQRGAPTDRLAMLLADTPLKKLKVKSKEAEKATESGDLWGALKLRQECLALANIYFGPYRGAERGHHPMLLATAHFRLAQAYANLKCYHQVGDHSNAAIQALPQEGVPSSMISAFKCDVNLLMGESLLSCEPPKPQIALQHFAAAGEVGNPEEVSEPSIKVLVAQSFAMIGHARLAEAQTARAACEGMESRLAAIRVRMDRLPARSMERTTLQSKAEDLTRELEEESGFERRRLDDAKAAFDKAIDSFTDVAFHEEDRVKKENQDSGEVDAHKKDPLVMSLYKHHRLHSSSTHCQTSLSDDLSDVTCQWVLQLSTRHATFRRTAELLFHLACVEGLRGDSDTELNHLNNIQSIQTNYGFLPLGILSSALKEKGTVFVVRKRYSEALETYKELLELQEKRFLDRVDRLAVAQGDAFKLIGNVYVAQKLYHRALEYYAQALDLFSKYMGPRSRLAIDLEQRIDEIRSNYMIEA